MKPFTVQQKFRTHLWALRIGLTLATSELAAAQFIHRADLHDFLTGMALGLLLVAVISSFAIAAPTTDNQTLEDFHTLNLG